MPTLTGPALAFPTRAFPSNQQGVPSGLVGELGASALVGRYGTLVKAQKVFYTSAIITSPVLFSTAGQLGPIIWNKPGSGLDAHILGVFVGQPTATSVVSGAIGYASAVQATQPTLGGTSGPIVAVNAYAGGGPSQMAAILAGSTGNAITVNVLPAPIFLPLVGFTGIATVTTVLSTPNTGVDVAGSLIIGPGNVGYLTASATLTSAAMTIGVIWAELPA
jgi:hypothetical protein